MRAETPGVGCGLVFLDQGRILLLQRRTPPEIGAWGIPGGKVDFLETSEDAVKREAFEETGLRAYMVSQIGVSEQIFAEERQHWLAPIFLAEDFDGEASLHEPDNHHAIGWFPLDDLPAPLTLPTLHALDFLKQLELDR